MDLIAIWIIVICVMVAWYYWTTRGTWTYGPQTGKYYWVQNRPGRRKAAAALAFLETNIDKFIRDAWRMYPGDVLLAKIRKRWDKTLAEATGGVAYSTNKKFISICVRDAQGKIEKDLNSAMFVLLHELAHVAENSQGHTPKFWATFRTILEMAVNVGVYKYRPMSEETYCGQRLGHDPLACVMNNTCRRTR